MFAVCPGARNLAQLELDWPAYPRGLPGFDAAPDGPTSQLLNIARGLDREAFEPLVVTLSAEPSGSMQTSFARHGLPVKSLSMSRLRGALNRRWRDDLERVSGRRLEECVLHSQGIRADVISSQALSGVPRLATARNYPYDDYVMKYGGILGGWMARRHLQALRSLPLVVACSTTLASQLRPHRIETTVIRNGVDTTQFKPPTLDERARARVALGIRPRRPSGPVPWLARQPQGPTQRHPGGADAGRSRLRDAARGRRGARAGVPARSA
jgi:hypothetical protein